MKQVTFKRNSIFFAALAMAASLPLEIKAVDRPEWAEGHFEMPPEKSEPMASPRQISTHFDGAPRVFEEARVVGSLPRGAQGLRFTNRLAPILYSLAIDLGTARRIHQIGFHGMGFLENVGTEESPLIHIYRVELLRPNSNAQKIPPRIKIAMKKILTPQGAHRRGVYPNPIRLLPGEWSSLFFDAISQLKPSAAEGLQHGMEFPYRLIAKIGGVKAIFDRLGIAVLQKSFRPL